MSDKPAVCVRIADDLLATGIGEASPGAAERVGRHVAMCGSCRRELEGYRALEGAVTTMRARVSHLPVPAGAYPDRAI
jgi:anti-sigma factor RsiW